MDDLKRKAVTGLGWLMIKRLVLQFIISISSIILARLLAPQDFGAFAIAGGIVNIMTVFSSLGLATAILQKKKNITDQELQASFSLSISLTSITALVIYLLSPFIIVQYYPHLAGQGVIYLRLLAVSLIASTFKEFSAVLMERRLDFKKSVIGETLEIFLLQIIVIFLALKGFGGLSFAWGTFISRFLVAGIFFLLCPWKVGLKFSFKPLKKLLSFGLNYQLTTIVGTLNGAVGPIIVGRLIQGDWAMGIINWAGGVAVFTRAIPELVGRVFFTLTSRIQSQKDKVRQVLEKSIHFSLITALPTIAIIMALAHPITYIIYTDKWLPGIPSLYLYCLQSLLIVLGGIFTSCLLALGEVKKVRNISFFWAVLQWLLTIPLVKVLGFIGLPLAGLLVSATLFIPLKALREKISFKIFPYFWPYFVYSLVSGGGLYLMEKQFPTHGIWELLIKIILGILFYLLLLFIFKRKIIIEEGKYFWKIIKKRS